MKATERFYLCEHCGNMAGLIHDAGVPMMCCGQPMKHLVANTTDAATEKHVPAVTIEGNTLKVHVGEVTHPMLEEHYIQWIYLQTENGGQRISLHPNEAPEATFSIEHDAPVAVYEGKDSSISLPMRNSALKCSATCINSPNVQISAPDTTI